MDLKFWGNPAAWPSDMIGTVFLARALDQIGRASQPGWTGKEFLTKPIFLPQRSDHRSIGAHCEAMAILLKYRPDVAKLVKRSDYLNVGTYKRATATAPHLDAGQWKIAHECVEEVNRALQPALSRRNRAIEALTMAIASGEVPSLVRPIAGGRCVPDSADWWHIDLPLAIRRAGLCQICAKDPFQSWGTPSDPRWIYVDAASLEKLLTKLKAPGFVANEQVTPKARKVDDAKPESHPGTIKSKRGRKPNPEVEALKSDFVSLMNHHGDFQPSDPEWNFQERAVEELLKRAGQGFTGETALRGRISTWLAEWRLDKPG